MKSSTTSRRGFFKTLAPKKEFVLRPPYTDEVSSFYENCITCLDSPCVDACEESIIQIKDDLPYISFENSGCTYCKECALACKKDVLHVETPHQINALFSIDTKKCLSWNGVVCFSCKDYCDERAIDFFGMFKPVVNDNCTSCGFCIAPCPNDAIKIKEQI